MEQLIDSYRTFLNVTNDPTAAAILAVGHRLASEQSGPMTAKKVAERLGVSIETIYKLCAENALPHTRVGKRITISHEQLTEYENRPQFHHLSAA